MALLGVKIFEINWGVKSGSKLAAEVEMVPGIGGHF